MTIEHPTSHAAEGNSVLADRLRAIPGAVSKATAKPALPKPAGGAPFAPAAQAGDAGALSRRLAAIPGATRAAPATAASVPEDTPYGRMVEMPAPSGTSTRYGAFGPRVRHFRVLEPKMQTRAMGTVKPRPDPAA